MQGDKKNPKAPLGNNYRPPQPLHHRPVRTNINFNVQVKNTFIIYVNYKVNYFISLRDLKIVQPCTGIYTTKVGNYIYTEKN